MFQLPVGDMVNDFAFDKRITRCFFFLEKLFGESFFFDFIKILTSYRDHFIAINLQTISISKRGRTM